MTPIQEAELRELLACPDFPRPIRRDEPHHGWRDGQYRDDQGILWDLFPCVLDTGEWFPRPDDDATAGCLLALLDKTGRLGGVSARPWREKGHSRWMLWIIPDDSGASDPLDPRRFNVAGETLGEAALRGLLRVWKPRATTPPETRT